MSSEHARIGRIRELLATDTSDIRLGIGDDAAILAASPALQVLSVDVAVEGVHFRRDFASLEEIGHRAFVAAASDLAAMGARPRCALTALVLPKALSDDELFALVSGLGAAAEELAMPIVGGNISAGNELSITTTVVGEVDGSPITRSGGRAGDGIYVTGHPGARALGLALLLGAPRSHPSSDDFIQRWRRPRAALLVGQRLRGEATAAVDISDGLLADLAHLCRASGVGATLHAPSLPAAPDFHDVATSCGQDALALALTGGEDYELLWTAAASSTSQELGTRIGQLSAEAGIRVLDADGEVLELDARGFDHFPS